MLLVQTDGSLNVEHLVSRLYLSEDSAPSFTAISFVHVLPQEEDADLTKRRRQSAAGLRDAEQPLSPVMVAHVVDALFDRWVGHSLLQHPVHTYIPCTH